MCEDRGFVLGLLTVPISRSHRRIGSWQGRDRGGDLDGRGFGSGRAWSLFLGSRRFRVVYRSSVNLRCRTSWIVDI
ncbi:hypothetical protein Dimus_023413, partial [Dionaea muscipula]